MVRRFPFKRDDDGLDVLIVSKDARPLRGGVARCLDGWLTGLTELGFRAGILALLPAGTEKSEPERRYGEWFIRTPLRSPGAADAFTVTRKLRTSLFLLRHTLLVRPRIAEMIRTLRPAHVVLSILDHDAQFVIRSATRVGASSAAVCYGAEFRPDLLARAPFRLPALQQTARVLTISEFTRALLRRLPIPLSDPSVVRPSMSIEMERVCQQDLPSEAHDIVRPKLVTVSRLVERKGIQHTIEALSILKQRGTDAHLSIVGEGDFEAALRSTVSRLGLQESVSFLGGLADVETLEVIRRSSIFVLTPFEPQPGNFEGFGIVYLEAGALGKPVIGSRSGGVPEAVIENETGLLVDPAAPAQIAEAVTCLCRNGSERARLGQAGRRWALAHAPGPSAATLAEALALTAR